MKIKKYKDFKQFGERDPKRKIKYIVVHCFALTVPDMVDVCNKCEVSSHYVIDVDGNIIQLVPENKTAWHAGRSFWYDEESLNGASIGIEIQNFTLGQTAYPEAQIKAFVELTQDIIKRHKILPQNVIGHSDVAPTRKVDPNFAFPWQAVAKKKIGLWPTTEKVSSRLRNKTLLKKIGYDVRNEKAALYAFMRHFAPQGFVPGAPVAGMEERLLGEVDAMPKPSKAVRQQLIRTAMLFEKKRKGLK